MNETKPCPYCAAEIRAGKGPRLDQRKTCGSKECRRRHHNTLNATWRAENHDYHRAQIRAWREANADRVDRVNREWRLNNRERERQACAAWRWANKERHQALIRAWERKHPEARMRYNAQRRAWKLDGTLVMRDWLRLVRSHGGRCAYCRSDAPITIDHVVPLSRGGRHAIGNVLPACRPCNSSKQDRLLVEWKAGSRAVARAIRKSGLANTRV